MAVAFDAVSSGLGSNNYSFTHTPVGTPRAVIVYTSTGGSSDVTAVTYGGVAMTQVSGSPNNKATTETGNVTGWFLGASIPTGAQSIAITSGAATKIAYGTTLTGAADTTLQDVDATINSDSQADPSVTLSLSGKTSFCSLCFISGQDAPTGVTPLTSWTARDETDTGAQIIGHYTYDTIGSTDVTAGWTQTADDAVAICLAVTEISGLPIPVAMNQYRQRWA